MIFILLWCGFLLSKSFQFQPECFVSPTCLLAFPFISFVFLPLPYVSLSFSSRGDVGAVHVFLIGLPDKTGCFLCTGVLRSG